MPESPQNPLPMGYNKERARGSVAARSNMAGSMKYGGVFHSNHSSGGWHSSCLRKKVRVA